VLTPILNTLIINTVTNNILIGVYNMELRKEKTGWTYHGDNYTFVLSDECYHEYVCLIIKPTHIKVLKNFSDMSNKDLKAVIIKDWFQEQNEDVKNRNNEKAKQRRANTKVVK
tara:strand:- start:483 stop:821 length:339 start_codon:yes stop_codon:yes gene_type:complete